MNDRDKYKDAFSRLHTSVDVKMEDYQTMKKPIKNAGKRLAIAAAVVCLIAALSAAAYAANWFGLKDLIVPSKAPVETASVEEGAIDGDASVINEPEEVRMDTISLQGYMGSPEYKGFAEWHEYYNSHVYDPDNTILNQVGNGETGLAMAYKYYGCYTQEMADKLDEIAEKYNLSLLGEMMVFDTVEEFMAAVAGGNIVGEANTAYPGYASACQRTSLFARIFGIMGSAGKGEVEYGAMESRLATRCGDDRHRRAGTQRPPAAKD